MSNKKIAGRPLAMLKALVSCDPRNTGKIAIAAGISRTFLINSVNGDRNISGEKLDRVLEALHLTSSWELKPNHIHVWSICADVVPLVIAVNELIPYPTIWPLTKTLNDDDKTAYRGFFLICSRNPNENDGIALPPFIIVDRDRYRLGRGNEVIVKPEDAKPITPELFQNGTWSLNKDSTLNLGNSLFDVNNIAHYGINKDAVMSLINHKPTRWDDVIRVATECGITPQDTLNMYKESRRRKFEK